MVVRHTVGMRERRGRQIDSDQHAAGLRGVRRVNDTKVEQEGKQAAECNGSRTEGGLGRGREAERQMQEAWERASS